MSQENRACLHGGVSIGVLFIAVVMAFGLFIAVYEDSGPRSNPAPTPLPTRTLGRTYEYLQVTDIRFSPNQEIYASRQGILYPQLVLRRNDDHFPIGTVSDHIRQSPYVFSSDGEAIIFTDTLALGTLMRYDIRRSTFTVFLGGLDSVGAFAIAPTEPLAALEGVGRLLRIYDTETQQEIARIAVADSIQRLEFSRDGRWLLVHMTQQIEIIDMFDPDFQRQQSYLMDRDIHFATFSPNGRSVWMGTAWGQLVRYDIATRQSTYFDVARGGPVQMVALNPAGDRLALLTARGWLTRGEVAVWALDVSGSLESDAPLWEAPFPDGVHHVAFAPDGTLVILPRGEADAHPVFTPTMIHVLPSELGE